MTRKNCPTPWKVAHPNSWAASRALHKGAHGTAVYPCCCGAYHTTSRRIKPPRRNKASKASKVSQVRNSKKKR